MPQKKQKNTATSQRQRSNDLSTKIKLLTLERNNAERIEKEAMNANIKEQPTVTGRQLSSGLWLP